MLILGFHDAIERHRGAVPAAAAEPETRAAWLVAEPETRAAVLLCLAWSAREASELADGRTPAAGHAAELQKHARSFDGQEATEFHGRDFPAGPLPGEAGAMATALGSASVTISLETALLLMVAE